MKKIIILLALLAAGSGAYFVLREPPMAAALLYIDHGDVQVDTGSGWTQATDELELKQGAKVRTLNGEASIIFLEGEIVYLEPGTEMLVEQVSKSVVKLSQKTGETWNKITKLSGISGYITSTPNTVATVRGTQFIYNDSILLVKDGKVGYGPLSQQDKIFVNAGKGALATSFDPFDLTKEQLAKFDKYQSKYLELLKRLREREIKKHTFLLKLAAQKGYTEQQIREQLERVDRGELNEDELYEKVPAPFKPSLRRLYELTKEIKKAIAQLATSASAHN